MLWMFERNKHQVIKMIGTKNWLTGWDASDCNNLPDTPVSVHLYQYVENITEPVINRHSGPFSSSLTG